MSDLNKTTIQSVFYPRPNGEENVAWARPAAISPLLRETERDGYNFGATLSGFEACLVCPDEWNTDFVGPTFAARNSHRAGRIRRLTLAVTTNSPRYPVQATGYVSRLSGEFLGRLDLRYFGMNLPRSLTFDVSSQNLSSLNEFMIAFQVSGGGSPKIPFPPLISSVSLEIEIEADAVDVPESHRNQLSTV